MFVVFEMTDGAALAVNAERVVYVAEGPQGTCKLTLAAETDKPMTAYIIGTLREVLDKLNTALQR